MDHARFFGASRVVIVAGKGGVGKTTVSAVLARAAARTGPVDASSSRWRARAGWPSMFDVEPLGLRRGRAGRRPTTGTGSIRARTLTPDDALLEYLREHGLGRLSKRLVSSGALDMVATAVPGIRDILVLGKVKQLERAARTDGTPT